MLKITPVVSISEGLSLTDRDANRFARRMMNELGAFNMRAMQAMAATTRKDGASLGNPIGQRRAFNRIVKAMGPTLLHGHIETGKRGYFSFYYTTFYQMDGQGDLFLINFRMNGKQEDREERIQTVELMRFTAHSLQRLIQRAGVREADDYIPILKALSLPSMALAAAANRDIPCGQWPLPITINGRRLILVVKTPPEDPVPTVVTVLKGEWREQPAMLALEELLANCETNDTDDGLSPYRDAFNAAATHLSERT